MAERRGHRTAPGRLFRWLERAVLSVGMSAIAFVVERRLLRAIARGGVKPAPRTAAGTEGSEQAVGVGPESASAADEVRDQPQG